MLRELNRYSLSMPSINEQLNVKLKSVFKLFELYTYISVCYKCVITDDVAIHCVPSVNGQSLLISSSRNCGFVLSMLVCYLTRCI